MTLLHFDLAHRPYNTVRINVLHCDTLHTVCCSSQPGKLHEPDSVFMRPSSLGGGRILRRTLSVRLSVRLSVCPSVPLSIVTERHVAPPSELQ